jgi:hypothetical protein
VAKARDDELWERWMNHGDRAAAEQLLELYYGRADRPFRWPVGPAQEEIRGALQKLLRYQRIRTKESLSLRDAVEPVPEVDRESWAAESPTVAYHAGSEQAELLDAMQDFLRGEVGEPDPLQAIAVRSELDAERLQEFTLFIQAETTTPEPLETSTRGG